MKSTFLPIVLLTICLISCNANKITTTQITPLTKTSRSWNGTKLPKYGEGDPEVTILKIVIPPKTKLSWHQHPEINAGVLLKGELTVISEAKDTLYLKAGDPIVELVNVSHYGRNDSKKPAEIIVFYAGIKDKPITVLDDDSNGGH